MVENIEHQLLKVSILMLSNSVLLKRLPILYFIEFINFRPYFKVSLASGKNVLVLGPAFP